MENDFDQRWRKVLTARCRLKCLLYRACFCASHFLSVRWDVICDANISLTLSYYLPGDLPACMSGLWAGESESWRPEGSRWWRGNRDGPCASFSPSTRNATAAPRC